MQDLDPTAEVGFGPVAISAADVDYAMGGEFREDEIDFSGRCVVGVDEESNAVGVSGCQVSEGVRTTLSNRMRKNKSEYLYLRPLLRKLLRMFPPGPHNHDPVEPEDSERVAGKSDDRIMDSRIIFEDGWMMMAWSRDGGMDCLAGRFSFF